MFDSKGERNEPAGNLDELVTHHPRANAGARLVDGELRGVERPEKRSHALVGGEFQEVEMPRTDEYSSIQDGRVLLVKDFILEDPKGRRDIDVPSPVAGHVSRVDVRNGLVEIKGSRDGEVIARVRHMQPISVKEGEDVAYGQTLGTQNNVGIPGLKPGRGVHVHLEMDTRHYQGMDAYLRDIGTGRLPVEAERRAGVAAPVLVDDGVQRIGESGSAVWTVQRALYAQGYTLPKGAPVVETGVYTADMQGAVLAFQRQHGIAPTGDIDAATFQAALRVNQLDRLGPVPSDPSPRSESKPLAGLYELPTGRQTSGSPAATPHANPSARAPLAATDPTPAAIQQHPLYSSASSAVDRLDASLGRTRDAASDRLTASMVLLGAESGLSRIDHVVLSDRTPALPAGHNVFAVQGAIGDPRSFVAHLKTDDAY